jgi:hypothetical protein
MASFGFGGSGNAMSGISAGGQGDVTKGSDLEVISTEASACPDA